MRLLGIETSDYAGISSQFIPLDSQLILLVGKNNSGKSATLHYLNAVSQPQAIKPFTNEDSITLDFYFELENSDNPLRQADWDNHQLIANGATLRFIFRLALNGIRHQQPIFQGGHLYAEKLNLSRTVVSVGTPPQLLAWNGSHNTIANGGFAQFNEVEAALRLFLDPVYIAPHRAIDALVPMTTLREVPMNGGFLPTFLQTLNNENREAFQAIESAFSRLFPEFDQIQLVGDQTNIGISLRRKTDQTKVSINRCGNGLEQALIILASLFGSRPDQAILLDEPHNFLHPGAERVLLSILRNSGRKIIVATHSPTFINGAAPNEIVLIQPPGTSFNALRNAGTNTEHIQVETLAHIGFRNSDALFHDFLVFVEGPSDADILPILLKELGVDNDVIGTIGFPPLRGVDVIKTSRQLQHRVSTYENLLIALGEAKQKHIYLFDRDRAAMKDDLARMRFNGEPLSINFSIGLELENSLLIPRAIAKAIRKQSTMDGIEEISPTSAEIEEELKQVDLNATKGSDILSNIYAARTLVYDKRISGRILAECVEANDPGIK